MKYKEFNIYIQKISKTKEEKKRQISNIGG